MAVIEIERMFESMTVDCFNGKIATASLSIAKLSNSHTVIQLQERLQMQINRKIPAPRLENAPWRFLWANSESLQTG